MDSRKCADCQKSITYKEFCRNNPLLNKAIAKDFWNNKLISIYCLDCFYNRPERPFKIRRGRHRTYYQKQPSFY